MERNPENDHQWMLEAIEAAKPYRGYTTPNPPVGCVLVKDGVVVGRGGHKEAGGPHGEVEAIRSCANPEGTTAYVTLEPCNHYGRTGPCVVALVEAGVKCVVIGVPDPNRGVTGGGAQALVEAGIEVVEHVASAECEYLMAPFLKVCRTGYPFVTVKMASTLDGRVGDPTGPQVWLTGEQAQEAVHESRDRVDAILVGSGTVLADDPRLTTRLSDGRSGRQPIRVILDRRGRVPMTAGVVTTAGEIPTRIYTHPDVSADYISQMKDSGVDVRVGEQDHTGAASFLDWVLKSLAADGLQQIWCEGGPELVSSLFRFNHVDEVVWFLSMSVGGAPYLPAVSEQVTEQLAHRPQLDRVATDWVGNDLRIRGLVRGRRA